MNTRFNMKVAAALGVAAALCFTAPAFAQDVAVPNVVPYQGYLTLGNGNPVNNTVSLTFRLYANADDAQAVWTETHDNVEVSNGTFYVYLGMGEDGVTEYFEDGENNYLTVEVNEDGEASPTQKIGSVPYAILAGDSQQLGGYGPDYYATQTDIANFITQSDLDAALEGYVTTTELNNAIANFITQADLDAAIANFVTQTQLDQAIANLVQQGDLDNYVTITYLENQNYITQNQLDEAIDNVEVDLTDYVTNTELTQILNGYVTDAELAAAIANLQNQIDNLQTQVTNNTNNITNLTNTVEQLEVNGGGVGVTGYILGVTAATRSGINVNGQTGLRGADQLCRNTFGNEPTAHMCTEVETQRALASQNFDNATKAAVGGQATWSIGGSMFSGFDAANSVRNTCWNMLYPTAHIGRGTHQIIFFDTAVDGGQTGHYYTLQHGKSCGTAARVLCCR